MDDKTLRELPFTEFLRSGTFKSRGEYVTLQSGGCIVPNTIRINQERHMTGDHTDQTVQVLIDMINAYTTEHNLTVYGCDDGCIAIETDTRQYTAWLNHATDELTLDQKYMDMSDTVMLNLHDEIVAELRKPVDVKHKEGEA